MNPPRQHGCGVVDEKPSIQALERVHGYLKLPNGRAAVGQLHNHKQNGTDLVRRARRRRRTRAADLDGRNLGPPTGELD